MILEEKDDIIFNISSINKKTWIRSDYQFNFNTPWMIEYDNFLKNENTEKLSKELKIKIRDFWNEDNTDVILPRFELNWVIIDFYKPWFDQIKRNITIKEFLYIYYHFIFWIDLYTYIEIKNNKEKDTKEIKMEILNSFSNKEISEKINQYLIEEKVVYEIPDKKYQRKLPKETYEGMFKIWQDWEWKKVNIYHINNEKEDTTLYICPIISKLDNDKDLIKLKKVLSKLSPNQNYSKNKEENKKSILKTGEIFDYLVASSKWYTKEVEKDKIYSEIINLWKEESISNEEIEKWIESMENFLANIL
mgnify:CR=1 FL=1